MIGGPVAAGLRRNVSAVQGLPAAKAVAAIQRPRVQGARLPLAPERHDG
jgi:hypothetical protein